MRYSFILSRLYGVPGWKSYLFMLLLFIAAIVAAIGHHCFYTWLDGREVDTVAISQAWIVRVGNTFAFVFKGVLVAGVGIAFCQRFWFAVRRESIRVNSLDAMFGVLGNPINFFNKDLLLKTKVLFIIAVVCWLLPLSAIFAPGALTSTPIIILLTLVIFPLFESTVDVQVPVLGPLTSDVGFVEAGPSETYLGPSAPLRRIAIRVLTNGELITWPSPCGINCSYTATFFGPAYQCNNGSLEGSPLQNSSLSSGVSPYYAIATDDTMWISTGISPNINVTYCTFNNATYTTNVQYTNNLPVMNTSLELHQRFNLSAANLGFFDLVNLAADQTKAEIEQTWAVVNQVTIHLALLQLLAGSVSVQSVYGGFLTTNTLIELSSLVTEAPFDLDFGADFPQRLVDTMVNITLSMSNFLYQPAIDSIVDTTNVSAINVTVPATLYSFPARYTYAKHVLWAIYGAALGSGIICIGLGSYMLYRNGVDANMSFSQVLVTTHNYSLDQLCKGSTLGGETISTEVQKAELRFDHTGFIYVDGISQNDQGVRNGNEKMVEVNEKFKDQ